MTLPGFIGIGTQKSGTTWLYTMLAQNPSIWVPPFKEVHFFDRLKMTPEKKRLRAQQLQRSADRLEKSKKRRGSGESNAEKAAFLRSLAGDNIQSYEWYQSIFDHPDAVGKVTGEITPSYLDIAKNALPEISAMLPTTKFVLIVREPLSRSLSQMRMAISKAGATPETREEWTAFILRLKKILRGTYDTAIPSWRACFGPDRLLILPFGRLKHDPAGLLRDVEDFIGAERLEKYRAQKKKVYMTKDIEIPQWVKDQVEEMVRPQKTYLIEAFGQDFYDATR
jgi:hypothetical protein